MNSNIPGRILPLGMALVLAACGGSGGGADTGTLSLALTDTPADEGIAEVNIQFTGLEVQAAGGAVSSFVFDPPRNIDLWALQEGISADLIRDAVLPAGMYTWIRLDVNAEPGVRDSYVRLDTGEEYPLRIPSSALTGLKLVRPFAIPVNGEADFIIDWDLARAIHQPEGVTEAGEPVYYLVPALRLLDRVLAGSIRGVVDESLVYVDAADAERCAPDGGNRAYLFEKPTPDPVIEDDIDQAADDLRAEVLATAPVRLDLVDGRYRFVFGFVAPGDYTVAFTCSASADAPEADDYPEVADSVFDFEVMVDVAVTDATRTDVTLGAP